MNSQVVTRAPLSLPPDYGLRPPRPGAARPNEASPRDDAQEGLLRNLGNRGGRSSAKQKVPGHFTNGEAALLKRAEALNVDPKIREIVERESGRVVESDPWSTHWYSGKTNHRRKRLSTPSLRPNASAATPPSANQRQPARHRSSRNSKDGLHAARDVVICIARSHMLFAC